MALGKVTTENINRYQGEVDEIERRFVFLGLAPAELQGQLALVNAQTNFDEIFGGATPTLYHQLVAAQKNGGESWQAVVVGMSNDDNWIDCLPEAMELYSCEAAVVCVATTTPEEINAAQAAMEDMRSRYAREMFAMLMTKVIDFEPEDPEDEPELWNDWINTQIALTKDIAADRVMIVGNLSGNQLGILAGRLARHDVSIADSPMRVATGAVLGMLPLPEDGNGNLPPDTIYESLDSARLNTPQTYADYPGIYWADGNVLDVPGGDFSVIEDLRVVLKAAREVRLLAIPRIADRQLNSTPNSISKHETYFAGPLRAMANNAIGDQPGDIQPPSDNAVEINWPSYNTVNIFITVTPYNSAKAIRLGIALDRQLQE